jgi:hypothetical protein
MKDPHHSIRERFFALIKVYLSVDSIDQTKIF